MNRDDVRKILGEEATEEQITNVLNNFHIQESNKVKELEKQIATLNEQNSKHSDYDDIKKQLDDINQANMTEQEKLARDKEEIAKNLAESRIIKNTAKAKDILAGLNVSDAIIAKLVSEDETTTLNSVNELKTMLETQKEAVVKETKESLTNLNLEPTLPNVNQNDDGVMTFDKFSKMDAIEQNKWVEEHPEEFKNL